MKMMNDMMKMNGDLDDMGMKMSLNQMDMNVVMYPEITGDATKKQTTVSMRVWIWITTLTVTTLMPWETSKH
jgi:hypothetical protein